MKKKSSPIISYVIYVQESTNMKTKSNDHVQGDSLARQGHAENKRFTVYHCFSYQICHGVSPKGPLSCTRTYFFTDFTDTTSGMYTDKFVTF